MARGSTRVGSRGAALGFVRFTVVALAGALVVASACSKKSADEDDLSGGMGDSEFRDGSDVDRDSSGFGSEPERVRELGSIYFDFDSSAIRSDARTTLKANEQAMRSRSEWKTIILEGHTDERGSEEYNLALGERRANAAKQYLVDLGASPSRLVTVSFGEGSPAVQGHDESAWRWNRRVEFKVSRK